MKVTYSRQPQNVSSHCARWKLCMGSTNLGMQTLVRKYRNALAGLLVAAVLSFGFEPLGHTHTGDHAGEEIAFEMAETSNRHDPAKKGERNHQGQSHPHTQECHGAFCSAMDLGDKNFHFYFLPTTDPVALSTDNYIVHSPAPPHRPPRLLG